MGIIVTISSGWNQDFFFLENEACQAISYVCIPGDDLGKCCLFSLLLGVGKEDQVDRIC